MILPIHWYLTSFQLPENHAVTKHVNFRAVVVMLFGLIPHFDSRPLSLVLVFTSTLQLLQAVVADIDLEVCWIEQNILRSQMRVSRCVTDSVQLLHCFSKVSCNVFLVFSSKWAIRFVQQVKQREFLRHVESNPFCLFVEVDAFDRQKPLAMTLLKLCGFLKNSFNNIWLHIG